MAASDSSSNSSSALSLTSTSFSSSITPSLSSNPAISTAILPEAKSASGRELTGVEKSRSKELPSKYSTRLVPYGVHSSLTELTYLLREEKHTQSALRKVLLLVNEIVETMANKEMATRMILEVGSERWIALKNRAHKLRCGKDIAWSPPELCDAADAIQAIFWLLDEWNAPEFLTSDVQVKASPSS